MTPEEREALMLKYETKQEDVSPEVWQRAEESKRRMQEKIDRGEVLKSWSKDNTPIGLNSNMQPFPLTEQPGDTTDDSAEPGPNPTTH